ncbi:MAG: pseudouridine synthase [Holophagae bacterium]|nr:MAG: pseudouridine synthase [Holophagae bacterium]
MSDPDAAAVRPSVVTLPERAPCGVVTLIDFFVLRFPRIPEATWRARFAAGKVWAADGPVAADAPYRPLLGLFYRREMEREPPVRTDLAVVWSDDDLLVVDKPPHLPVTPGGPWVRHTLLHLLEGLTGCTELAPLHRLDRLTSGLVVLSRRRSTRAQFARMFQPGAPVEKTYTAVCELTRGDAPERTVLDHHIRRSGDEYWRQVVVPDEPPNASSEIELIATAGRLAAYRVRPRTGRKHQLRVQLAAAGLPVLGDPLYGTRRFHDPEDLTTRLWLDAHGILVTGFPRPGGAHPLTAAWNSSRDPAALFAQAAAAAASDTPRR